MSERVRYWVAPIALFLMWIFVATACAAPVTADNAHPEQSTLTPTTPAQEQTTPGSAEPAERLLPLGDPEADTTSATVKLQAGFIMDPYLIPVIGHSSISASELAAGCNGFVGAEPNVTVNWSGQGEQLGFFVYSDSDPVLLIQLPDGSFVCNDDAGLRTVDPLVTMDAPAPGDYQVYVGSARQNEPALGFLAITQAEMDDARLAQLDLTSLLRRRVRPLAAAAPRLAVERLLTTRSAIFGDTALTPGFTPVRAFAAGGGDIPAFQVVDQQLVCAGFLSPIPSYSFTWAGDSQTLRLFFEAAKDSSLAVVTPDRQVICNMDAAGDNLNPTLEIPEVIEGRYNVYVASMLPDSVVWGWLTITDDAATAPAVLSPAGQQ